MKLSEYAEHDAVGLAQLVKNRDISAGELAGVAAEAIAAVNGDVNAVVEAWEQDPGQVTRAAARPGPLAGSPFLVKDMGVAYAGRLSESGSRLASGNRPDADSELAARFTAAGLVALGRTATPEFAWSTETQSALFGVTRNPWDTTRTPGGSSGGAAAAVASGAVPLAHATDAAGSIRIPAALCGLVGLRPSRGRVTNGPALDEAVSHLASQLGVSRSVRDTAALLDAVSAPDPGSPFGIAPASTSYLQAASTDPHRLRIGLFDEAWGGRQPTATVRAATRQTAELCAQLGHEVEETQVDLGTDWESFVRCSSVLWVTNIAAWVSAVAAATGRPADGSMLEPQTLAVYDEGRRTSALELLAALDARNAVTRAVVRTFDDVDVVLMPTVPDVASAVGTLTGDLAGVDGHAWTERLFTASPFTPFVNSAGLPAVSLPLAHDAATDMPIGIQLVGGPGREDHLLALAGQLERAAPWTGRRPRVFTGAA